MKKHIHRRKSAQSRILMGKLEKPKESRLAIFLKWIKERLAEWTKKN